MGFLVVLSGPGGSLYRGTGLAVSGRGCRQCGQQSAVSSCHTVVQCEVAGAAGLSPPTPRISPATTKECK